MEKVELTEHKTSHEETSGVGELSQLSMVNLIENCVHQYLISSIYHVLHTPVISNFMLKEYVVWTRNAVGCKPVIARFNASKGVCGDNTQHAPKELIPTLTLLLL